jgi:hypothetical protein
MQLCSIDILLVDLCHPQKQVTVKQKNTKGQKSSLIPRKTGHLRQWIKNSLLASQQMKQLISSAQFMPERDGNNFLANTGMP